MRIVSLKNLKWAACLLLVIILVISSVLLTWRYIRSQIFVNKKIIIQKTMQSEEIVEQMEMFDYLTKNPMRVPKLRADNEIAYNADNLPAWDYTRLINLTRFKFILENTVCYLGESVDVLVGVYSRPQNIDWRNAIRNSWGKPMEGLKILFFIGWVDTQAKQDALDEEDREHHDLIQGNFIDSFENLTYKHIMIFKYVIYYCPSAKYILKTDDDVYVNIEHIVDFLKQNISDGNNYKKNLILGDLMDSSLVIREKGKYFVPFEENPHRFHPAYVSGYAIIYSYDVVFRLYREAQRGDYSYIEDAFVSGVLAKRINVNQTRIPGDAEMKPQVMQEIIWGYWTRYNKKFWYVFNIDHKDLLLLHKLLTQRKMAFLKEIAVSHSNRNLIQHHSLHNTGRNCS